MATILVTGAAGFIGAAVTHALLARGDQTADEIADLKRQIQVLSQKVDELETENAQLRSQAETWRDQASQKDAELTVLGTQAPEAATVCAELYQVIGSLAGELGALDHLDVQRALANARAHKLVHRDLLPWPKQALLSARPLDP